MSREWADDTPKAGIVRVRCAEPLVGLYHLEGDEVYGCGWTGSTVAVESYWVTEWEMEECPECGGKIEVAP